MSKYAPYRRILIPAIIIFVQLLPRGVYSEPTIYSEIHCKHFFYGLPQGTPPTNDLIIRDIYALSSNDETKFPDWVAFRLDKATATGENPGVRDWLPDPWLSDDERFEEEDFDQAYVKFLYDMGHLAPLDAFVGTTEWADSNYLSNITPQHRNLNRGKWKQIEGACTYAAREDIVIYVYAGPLYQHDMPPLDNSKDGEANTVRPHVVPSGYWKVVFYQTLEEENSIYCASFIFDNAPVTGTALDHLVTVDEIEDCTGLDLMPELETDKQAIFESRLYEDFASDFVNRQLEVSNPLRVPE